ncbi:MarR family transcriptional regulator [Photobacterium lutimaris]|uniref:MarR family transcriptional regulator n=2 Tax=Photobacterium lutimaris TaxID=388278 RepID=A0A2T3J2B8_9GAMM|nr:MarR family transcriptional regulator [Photobacterium lutimaris]PSU35193.1 MarR family transcriptional regulator [Photobacterium lutimaris]TDR71541.1 MarR family protein [Photobacterium lutimaris]
MDNLAQSGLIDPNLVRAARAVPHQVGLVKLSKTQLRVLQSIRCGEEVTAGDIAERCELSSAWASSLLRRLTEKGYLSRITGKQDTGGIEFQYLKR